MNTRPPSIIPSSEQNDSSFSGSLYSNGTRQSLSQPGHHEHNLRLQVRHLTQQVQSLTRSYERLLDVTRSATSLRNPAEVFSRILESAVTVSDAERGFLFLCDPDQKPRVENLTVASAFAVELDELTQTHFEISRSSIARALKTGGSVTVAASAGSSHSMHALGLRAILCAPLKLQDRVLGVLYLDTRKETCFSLSTADLVVSFAAQAAICIENVKLMNQREQALRRQHEERVRRESLSAFLAVASRELKGPMASLRPGLGLLQNSRLDEESKSQVAGDMERSMRRLEGMLRTYEELHQAAQGELPQIYRQEIPLGKLLQEQIGLVSHLLGPEQLSPLSVQIECPEEVVIRADREKLKRLLNYLLENSVLFSPREGQITIRYHRLPSHDCLILEDEGPVIGLEQRGFIRTGYPRLTGDLNGRGEALGLFLASQLAQAHGGTLSVQGELRHRFVLELPRLLNG